MPAAQPSGLQVVGPDKVKTAAARGIGIYGNHRNPRVNRRIDPRLQH